MRNVRGLCHNTLMEYAMGDSVAPQNPQKRGWHERLGTVCKGCAGGLSHTSSHGLHTSVAIYVGKTGSKGSAEHRQCSVPKMLDTLIRQDTVAAMGKMGNSRNQDQGVAAHHQKE